VPRPQWHALLSAAIYVSGGAGRREDTAVVALSNTLMDVDHACDWAYFQVTGDRGVQLVPLHSWELAILLTTVRSSTARLIGAGMLMHLLTDWIVGEYSFARLSLGYRIAKRFRTDYLGDWALWPRGRMAWRSLVMREVAE